MTRALNRTRKVSVKYLYKMFFSSVREHLLALDALLVQSLLVHFFPLFPSIWNTFHYAMPYSATIFVVFRYIASAVQLRLFSFRFVQLLGNSERVSKSERDALNMSQLVD